MMDATERVALIHPKCGWHQILPVVNARNHLRPGGRGAGWSGKQGSSQMVWRWMSGSLPRKLEDAVQVRHTSGRNLLA